MASEITTLCPICNATVSAQYVRGSNKQLLILKKHNFKRMALISGSVKPFNELCKGSMQKVTIEK